MLKLIRLVILAFPLLMIPVGAAQAEESTPVKSEIYSEGTSIKAGEPFWVAVKLDIDEGWHAYWKNPGMSGFASSIDWELPEGFKAEEGPWPTPERMEKSDGIVYGYHDVLTILTKITPPKDLKAGQKVNIRADLAWLVCSENTCLPGKAPLNLNLEITDKTPQIDQAAASVFANAREKLPLEGSDVQARAKDQTIELKFPKKSLTFDHAYFYPEINGVVDDAPKLAVSTLEEHHVFALPVSKEGDSSEPELKGVLVLKDSQGRDLNASYVNVPLKVVSDKAPSESAPLEGIGFPLALAMAFIGGVILNLMPCVLPVISLKIFSFVKMAGENRAKIIRHGLLFTFGVLVSFWALAGVLILLRAYGQMAGWGFQLQEPLFVALLAALIFIFGLSLFGLFEVGTMFSSWAGQKESDAKQKQGGAVGAFLSGVLATAVATPCTGPFLGSALGVAMTLSAPFSLMIFTAIALGMSFPYLLISAFPKFIKFLPKPGKWMVAFKEFLGFCMVATALWLTWVFGAETGYDALFTLLTAFLILAAACWIYGRWANPSRKKSVRIAALIITFLVGALGFYEIVQSTEMISPSEEVIAMADPALKKSDIRKWEPFSRARLEELKSEGKPVFIDFTAKWCLICQTNHKVLESSEVADKFAELGVVKVLADWTKKNPEISEELQKFGRSGVPLYVLYGKDGKAEILPQVLTPDAVIHYLDTLE